MESTYFKNHTQSGILSEFPAPPATRQGSPPQPQECSPHERFLRHPRPPRRQRQVLHLRKPAQAGREVRHRPPRSEEHTSELQSLMRISYAVFRLKQKTNH